MTEAVYFAAASLELRSSAPCVTSTGSLSFDIISVASSGRPLSPARTLGGTIMLNDSMVSKSSAVGCLEKQPCTKARVAAMLVVRSSDAIKGRFFRLSPASAGSALIPASTKLMPANVPAPWVAT
jgi:hypothetical protein